MKKTYNNVIGIALGAFICLGLALPAHAQRGGEHSDGKTSGGGGSTPPPAAPAPQPQVQQQPQVQRSNPPQQQQQPQQQVQRSNPSPQQQQPQVQRSNPQQQQQSNSFGSQRSTNATGGSTTFSPRGQEHQQEQVFRPANPNGTRRYPGIGERNNTYTPRGYGNSYRSGGYQSYPGLEYGQNRITIRPRGFYYNNRDYYSTYYRPQLGFSLSVLPYGYYPFYFGSDHYYYSEGLYYRQLQDNSYSVVEPPLGATINKLPAKAQAIAINGMQYYELNGVYYQPITRDDGRLVYQIAGKDGELNTADVGTTQDDLPQVGDLVDNLPEGCKKIRLNHQKYYVSQEGYYFQDAIDSDGDKVFRIVGTPTDEPGN
jgi:hypothetical protein